MIPFSHHHSHYIRKRPCRKKKDKDPNMPPEAILFLQGTCLKAGAVQLEPDVLHTLHTTSVSELARCGPRLSDMDHHLSSVSKAW